MPAHTYRLAIINPRLACSNRMRFQEHGFGELGEKLLVYLRVSDHFHILFTRRNILVIGLAIALPYNAVKYNAYFLSGGFLVERSGNQPRCDLLVKIHWHPKFPE